MSTNATRMTSPHIASVRFGRRALATASRSVRPGGLVAGDDAAGGLACSTGGASKAVICLLLLNWCRVAGDETKCWFNSWVECGGRSMPTEAFHEVLGDRRFGGLVGDEQPPGGVEQAPPPPRTRGRRRRSGRVDVDVESLGDCARDSAEDPVVRVRRSGRVGCCWLRSCRSLLGVVAIVKTREFRRIVFNELLEHLQ